MSKAHYGKVLKSNNAFASYGSALKKVDDDEAEVHTNYIKKLITHLIPGKKITDVEDLPKIEEDKLIEEA